MIEVKNLTKKYGEKYALDNVSFKVEAGQVLGFLGPNGAGKSTTMNILTGYLSATSGQAMVAGYNILEDPIETKKHIGYLPELPPLYLDMTVEEYLFFMYNLKKCKLPRAKHIEEICAVVKINNVFHRRIKNLSKGYRQRVGVAQALIGNPDVLILDEPTVGLDPKQIIDIRNLIRGLSKKHTVVISSHILSEVQAVCDKVIVINKGKVIADGTPNNLSEKLSGDHKLLAKIKGPEKEVLKLLKSLPKIVSADILSKGKKYSEYTIETVQDYDVREDLFYRLSDRKWPLFGLRSSDLSLEDIFLQLIQESGGK